MKKYIHFYAGMLTLILLAVATPQQIKAQGDCFTGGCAFGGTQYPSTTFSNPGTTFVTVSGAIYGGEYQLYSVVAGTQYEWSYCTGDGAASAAGEDIQMTLFNEATTAQICYSDDYCGVAPKIQWTATFTGTVRVLTNLYYCTTNTTSHTLVWRAVGPSGPVNDNCSGAIAVACGASVTGSTTIATADAVTTCGGSPSAPGVWYTFVGGGQSVTASLCTGTNYDSRLAVYSGSCGALICEGENDDFCGLASQVTFTAAAGVTYYILVNGFGSSTGNFTLSLSSGATNDVCTSATTITPGSYTGSTVCTGNDIAPTCITGDGTLGGVWYQITGTANCSAFTASTCTGTTFDSKIRVFEGTCGALTCVTGNDDFCGLQSQVTWNYTPGTTYYILVHGFGSGEGAFTLTVSEALSDAVAPVANVATLTDVTSQCPVTSLVAPTATDNCVGTVTGTHTATFPITASTVVTWTYTDGTNTSTQTQNVVINDNTAPVPDAASLATITEQCSVTSLTAPTATDNCVGAVTGTHTATLPITASTTVTWTFTDGTNTSTQTQNIVINDNTAPVPNAASLATITEQCAVTSLTAPTATDNCAGTVTGTHTATLPITASTTVTWTYTDGTNTSTQTQNIVINDNTAPVPDAASLATITEQCSVTSLTAPTATDNCAGTVTGTHTATLPITASTTVTWTFTDGANTSTQTQNIVIDDNTAPVPDVATLATISEICSVTSLTAPTATDNCAGSVTATHDATLPITANTTITWTYTDGTNTTTQTQNVVILPVDASISMNSVTLTAGNTASGVTYQWIDCQDNNAPIAGETGVSYTASANGTYAVIVTQGTCSDTSNCMEVTDASLNEFAVELISVYPNPATDQLMVKALANGILDILDVHGKIVHSAAVISGENILSVGSLAIGTYTVRLTSGNAVSNVRLIVQRK